MICETSVGEIIDAIEFLDHFLNIAGGHALGVQRENFLVEAGEPTLMLGDQLRLKGGVPITGRLEGECPPSRR